MIVTVAKDLSQILDMSGEKKKVYIVGCAGCATLCTTGGEEQTRELGVKLSACGKEVSVDSAHARKVERRPVFGDTY